MIRTNRVSRPCEGLAGGQPGALSQNILNPHSDSQELPQQTHMHLEVKSGDCIFHAISGSGGHGDPWEREPEKVLTDVKDEKLSIAAAKEQYGVVIHSRELTIDWDKTTILRQKREPVLAAD